jgi:uracil-DNA glycosylase family 4
MGNDWNKQEWISAARNYIESQLRDGHVSEIPLIATPSVSQPKPQVQPTAKPSFFKPSITISGSLDEIRATLGDCTRCKLSTERKNIVYGVGNPKADLVIVGEAPGRDEDLQGEPFVGAAGQLLTDILLAIGLSRADVYICNVIKCRPPNNRPPEEDEIETCSPFVQAQIAAIQPKLICTLGKFATQTLLGVNRSITSMRGNFQDYKGIPLMPTFHPAYLLRNPDAKKDVWEDMKKIHAEYVSRTGKNIRRKGQS